MPYSYKWTCTFSRSKSENNYTYVSTPKPQTGKPHVGKRGVLSGPILQIGPFATYFYLCKVKKKKEKKKKKEHSNSTEFCIHKLILYQTTVRDEPNYRLNQLRNKTKKLRLLDHQCTKMQNTQWALNLCDCCRCCFNRSLS